MLTTDVQTHEIPNIYRRFAEIVGDSHWTKCVSQCKEAIRGNDFLREYMEQEYEIAYQLSRLGDLIGRYGALPIDQYEQRSLYPASSFATQILSLMDASTKVEAEKLRRRVHGALKNPADMRGLRLELSAATHFVRRGKQISWPETTGEGTFDILVSAPPTYPPLEVECKSIADDKGRKIHKKEVLDFLNLLKPNLKSTITGLTTGLSVVLTLPGRLPTTHRERLALAKALGRAAFAGNSCTLADGSTVRVTDFDVSRIGDLPNYRHPSELRQIIDGVTGTDNRQTIIIGTARGGALAIAIQSKQDDNLFKALFDTLSDAAARQLTKKRAGLLYTGFDGLNGEQLLSIAQQDQNPSEPPSGLRVAVSQFLSSTSREHVVGVGFVSRSSLRPVQDGLVESSGGTAYYFPRRESPFWSESFSGMFTWDTKASRT